MLKKNHLVTELPYIGKEYRVGFELMLTNYGTSGFNNVIHLTLGGDAGGYGDRSPACWVGSDKKMHCASAIDGNANGGWYSHEPILELNKWIRVEVSQTLVDGKVRRQYV